MLYKVYNIKFNMMTDCLYGSNNTVLLKLCDDFVFATTKILPILEGVAILITDIDGSILELYGRVFLIILLITITALVRY